MCALYVLDVSSTELDDLLLVLVSLPVADFYDQMWIGKALLEACQTQGVKREDLFITIKVTISPFPLYSGMENHSSMRVIINFWWVNL